MKITYICLMVILMFLLNISVKAQDYNRIRQELQEEQIKARSNIDALRQQIQSAERQISQTDDEFNRVFLEYQTQEREIALRDEVIRNLQEEGRHLSAEIAINRRDIRDLTDDLNRLIQNYQNTLVYLYKNGRVPDAALLLTSGSINQMLVRSFYLSKFEEYRRRHENQITEAQAELEGREKELIASQQRNEAILRERRSEQEKLHQGIVQQQRNVELLRRDRATLREKLVSFEEEVELLEKTLNELIEEEIRVREAENNRLRLIEEERRRRLARAEAAGDEDAIALYSIPSRASRLPSREELAAVEESFGRSKGKLPWPVEQGAISAQFGNKVNPLYGTTVYNPGIEIATDAQSPVRVVHEGLVFNVRPLPGFGNCIFVLHGRFITVYGNLSEVRVRRDTYLQAGDIIGLSGDSNSLKGPALFFMVREGNINLDPEQWITRN